MPDRTPVGWLLLEGLTNQYAGYVICLAKSKWQISIGLQALSQTLLGAFQNIISVFDSPITLLHHYLMLQCLLLIHFYLSMLQTSVSRSGLVWFFSPFWTRKGPDRSSEISFLEKNQTRLRKAGLRRSS